MIHTLDAADPREQRIAEILGDRYELLDLLDRGGFASVYRVRNLRLHRVEALKVLSDLLTEDADFSRRFEQEARVAASLDHPHIVKIYDYGTSDRFCWFSMQYIDGPSLGREIKTHTTIEPARVARIGVAVLDALAYSHARGIVHRDIKPDNVLLDSRSRPYLTDFGVAKSDLALVKTHAGTLLGSPAYMSPEQLQGKPLDGRSDVYSIGVTLYKALAGELPFSGEDTMRATLRRLSEPAPPLSVKRPDLHPRLANIVMRALERDPAKRFQSAEEMRDSLEEFLSEVTPARTPIPPALEQADAAETLVLTPTPRSSRAEISTEPPSAAPPEPAPPPPPRARGSTTVTRRRDSLGWIAAAIGVGIAATAALLLLRGGAARRTGSAAPQPASRPALAETAAPAPPQTTAPGAAPFPTAEPTAESQPAAPEPMPTSPPRSERSPARRRASSAAARPTLEPAAPTAAPTPEPVPTRAPRAAYSAPELESQAPLPISTSARAAHGNELVGLSVTVTRDGSVKDARVLSGVAGCVECDRAALAAVRRFRFRPARDESGSPVDAVIAISIRIPPL